MKCSGYIINGCRFHTKDREASLVTQNSGVSVMGTGMHYSSAKDKKPIMGDMCYYGVITEIWILDYLLLKIPIFKCDWVNNRNGVRVDEWGFTSVDFGKVGYTTEPFILATQAKQVFYVRDQLDPERSIVLATPQRLYYDDEDEEEEEIDEDNTGEDNDTHVLPDDETLYPAEGSKLSYTREDCEGFYIDITSDDDSDTDDLTPTKITRSSLKRKRRGG